MALTEQELEQRLGRITSSLIGAVLGLDPYTTPYQAWRAIKGERRMLTPKQLRACERGDRLEPVLLQYTADKQGYAGYSCPGFVPIDDWAGATTDALYYDDQYNIVATGEAKTINRFVSEAWEHGPPKKVQAQAHWHMMAHPKTPVCHVPVLVEDGFYFDEFHIERDDDLCDQLYNTAYDWHRRYVQADTPPPLVAADNAGLTEQWPVAGEEPLIASEEICDAAWEVLAARNMRDKALDDFALAQAQLKKLLQDSPAALGGKTLAGRDMKISWKNNASSFRVDYKAVCEYLGVDKTVLEKFTQLVPGDRVLRVTELKPRKKKGE